MRTLSRLWVVYVMGMVVGRLIPVLGWWFTISGGLVAGIVIIIISNNIDAKAGS